jgi:hypothetical protein
MAAVTYTVTDNKSGKDITLNQDLQGERTLADLLRFTKESLITIAKAALAEEQAQGFDEKPVTLVDRSKNKPIDRVNPLGQIEFLARAYIGDLITEAYDTVLRLSKVVSGNYYENNQVLRNNVVVAKTRGELARYLTTVENKPGDFWTIANATPYARRLETLGVSAKGRNPKRKNKYYRNRRRGGGKNRIIKPPNGAYALSYASLKARIGKFVDVRFKYLPGSELGLDGTFQTGTKSQTGRPYLYPVIVIADNRGGTIQ